MERITKKNRIPHIVVAVAAILLIGCKPLSPLFDQVAYKNTIDLKVESTFIMKEATESFDKHTDDVKELKIKIAKAYEYEKGRGAEINKETLAMWDSIRNENGALLGGFLKRWETEDTIASEYYIENKVEQVEKAFDIIIRVENKRRREAVELTKSE